MNDERKRTRKSVLTPELAGELAVASAPGALAPERQAALRECLLARVHADSDSQRFVTVRSEEGVWQALAPDIAMKVLDSDDSMQAFLLRLAPGACLPSHPHADDEMCFVLEGEATLGDITVGPGDYHLARAGTTHGDVTTRTGCLLLMRCGSGVAPHQQALRQA